MAMAMAMMVLLLNDLDDLDLRAMTVAVIMSVVVTVGVTALADHLDDLQLLGGMAVTTGIATRPTGGRRLLADDLDDSRRTAGRPTARSSRGPASATTTSDESGLGQADAGNQADENLRPQPKIKDQS